MPEPMLATPVDRLPAFDGQVAAEPKWDGFRALVWRPRDGRVEIVSRRGTPLARAFPDVAAAAERDLPGDCLLDGELVVWNAGRLDFDLLQQRLRSGAATATRLAATAPAHFVAFDLLRLGDDDLMPLPYRERRAALERLCAGLAPPWTLCPSTLEEAQARQWLGKQWATAGLEGLLLKKVEQPYLAGQRGWRKLRVRSTTEAIVGGVSPSLARPQTVLLGRLDADDRLHYVGRTTVLSAPQVRALAEVLAPAPPGHPWTGRRFTASWGSRESLVVALAAPELVAEVSADAAVDRGKWRHPVRWVRLRADLSPADTPPFGQGNQPSAG
ncbi:ATP-dependent DNA ligase [Streptomyces sp. NPDC053048]|uniref:ATP-dependent DNA ligase n=1 Tax=Streptomyces sp. NPDC053048 TaxID=3365694 RepID=UPI0037D80D89